MPAGFTNRFYRFEFDEKGIFMETALKFPGSNRLGQNSENGIKMLR